MAELCTMIYILGANLEGDIPVFQLNKLANSRVIAFFLIPSLKQKHQICNLHLLTYTTEINLSTPQESNTLVITTSEKIAFRMTSLAPAAPEL